MKDVAKKKEELLQELESLRQRVAQLEEAKTWRQLPDDELLRTFIASSLVGVYVFQDRKLKLVNLAFEKITGYSRAELLGMEAMNLVFPEDREMVRRCAMAMLKGQRSFPYEFRAVTKSGQVRWIVEKVVSVSYRGHQAALGSYMDITEQKRAAEKILQLNETLRLIRNANQLIVRVNSERELLEQACRQLVGGQNYTSAWIGLVQPDTYDVLPAAQSGFEEGFLSAITVRWDDSESGRGPTGTAIKTGKPFVSGNMVDNPLCPDPSLEPWRAAALRRGYCSIIALPLKVEDKVIGALNVYSRYADAFDNAEFGLLAELAEDISLGVEKIRQREKNLQMDEALRKAEARYRSTLDNMLEGCFIIDFSWHNIYVNKAGAQHARIPKDEMSGRTVMEMFPGIEQSQLFAHLKRCMEQRIPCHEDIEFSYADGISRWFDVSVEPVPEGIFVLSLDITDQKQAEEERQQSEKKLKEAETLREIDRLRTQLLANVSHELRTPLASIKGFTTTLLQPDVKWREKEQHEFLSTIDQECDRLTRLIADLLDMSRLEAGALKLERNNLRVSEVMEAVSGRLAILCRHHQLSIILPPDLPDVFVDEMRIGQVLSNLVENATKFSSPGTHVVIEARASGNEIIVSVTDKGPGIPSALMEKVFDRFYQVESIASGRKRGTGLGLSICRWILDAHGGKIWVESKEGVGSTFSFSLPISEEKRLG
ncbi:MAG: PAS domain S-box protein [Chloroflexi bacterium]|nr:PAS domain S-box protein [Chloroflexota bacterium]